MAKKIQLRRDTAANWTSVNPILADGEYGWEKNTGKWKVGDGLTAWNALAYRTSMTSAEITAVLGYTPANAANISNVNNTSDANKPVSIAQQTALDLKLDKSITANRQAASYTLVLADAAKLVEMNVATANNLTVPLNSAVPFPVGTQILISQYGAGQTTIVAPVGVTIRSASGKLKLTGLYSGATLVKIAADEWYLFGDIAA